MTWEPPKKYYIRCISGFHEAFPRSPVPQGPSHLLPLVGQLQRRSALVMRGNSLRPRKVRAQPPAPRALGPSSPIATTSPRMGEKEKKEAQVCQAHCYQRNGEPTREKEEGNFRVPRLSGLRVLFAIQTQ